MFGDRLGQVEKTVGHSSGLDMAQVSRLLVMLAPLVMGALGKLKRDQSLDPRQLAGLLGQERDNLAASQPAMGGFLKMLDSDGDGDVTDDALQLGSGLLKGFLKRR